MGPEILEFLILFSFFLLTIVTVLKTVRNIKTPDSIPNVPPSPWKLPVIGNIHQLVTSTPHRKLRDLAKIHGPLMHLQLGEVFTIVVSSAEYAREVMKTHDLIFASRPHLPTTDIASYDHTDIVFSPYGDYWKQLRMICHAELLSTKRIQSLRPIREEEINNLIRCIASEEGSCFNLTQAINSLLYTITSRAAFGKRYREQEEFISTIKEVIKLVGGFKVGDLFPSAKWFHNISGMRPKIEGLHRNLDRILETIIIDHRAVNSRTKEEEDLIDVLLKYEDSGSDLQDFHLTSNNIKAIILDVFAAGSDTAANTINWAMAEMLKDPRVLNKAKTEVRKEFHMREKVDETAIAEMKYLKAVIKETLRLRPTVPLLLPRECGQACDINGYHIPFKSRVIINAWAIARDPKYWTEPERFYPERFIDSSVDYKGNHFEYIPFGAGRRICPGMNYGLANVELALAFLLYHFDWKLPNGMKNEELDMTEEFGVAVSKKEDLYLIPTTPSSL